MEEEYLKRWRLILGGNEDDGTGITQIGRASCRERV